MTIGPVRLLEHADLLAGRQAGRGRPSETNHRRAVSSAYYAVFHATTESIAESVLPAGADSGQRGRLRRWVPHAKIRATCEYVTKASALGGEQRDEPGGFGGQVGSWPMFSFATAGGRRSAVSTELLSFARLFLRLQGARHDADYDHAAQFPKALALSYVGEARRAVELHESHAQRDEFRLLWSAVVCQPARG